MAGQDAAAIQLATQRHQYAKNQANREKNQVQRGDAIPVVLQPVHVREPLKIQSSPKCKARKRGKQASRVAAARKRIRCAAYGGYVSKKFFMQRSITSHLVAVFWRLSGMASSSISGDEMWFFRGSHNLTVYSA